MKKTKTYSSASFPTSAITSALAKLGPARVITNARYTLAGVSVQDISEEALISAYDKKPEFFWMAARSELARIDITCHLNKTDLGVEATAESEIDPFFGIFDVAMPPRMPPSVEADICCKPTQINWEAASHLANRLARHNLQVTEETMEFARPPVSVTYSDWGQATLDIRTAGPPREFRLRLSGNGPLGRFYVSITWGQYRNSQRDYILVRTTGTPDVALRDEIVAFLSLSPDVSEKTKKLPRTAFIAFRFDSLGEQLADRLSRYLSLLRFEVKTGRTFAPQSVGDKVHDRIVAQSLLFAIHTPGDDATWLNQETMLARSRDKQVFVLCDKGAGYKSGMLGDHEYIPFAQPAIEQTFLPIMEGLDELGFLDLPPDEAR